MSLFKTMAQRARSDLHGKRSTPRQQFRPSVEPLEQRCLLSADMVIQWNQIANQAAVNDYTLAPGIEIGPTRLSHAMAIVQAAVYDSVNSIDPLYKPYLIQVTNVPADASMDAAVAQAAHDTLVAMFPNQQAFFDSELASSLQGIPNSAAAVDGAAVGMTVASYILTQRANDGSQIDAYNQPVNYTFGQLPGQWRPDPLHPTQVPLTPDWGGVKPFGMLSENQFMPPPPPALNSLAYATAYEEVKAVGSLNSTIRTADQTQIAFFWGYDAQPGLCAPIRFYNQITQVIAQQEGNSEVENARLFALTNIAMADAAITCWGAKYIYDLWRPITAIRENDPGTGPTGRGSGNPYLVGQGDPNWQPLGAPTHSGGGNFTPPFPTYTSGHGTIGGALFKTLEDYYGTDNVHFTISTDEFNTITNGTLSPRSYDSFSQAAGENAMSRIYLGIHFHFDATNAITCGDHIADYDFTHLMAPLKGPAPQALPSLDAETQIQIAINHENSHGLNYQIGKFLDFMVAATAGDTGSTPCGPGAHNVGDGFGFMTAPSDPFKLGSGSGPAMSQNGSHGGDAGQTGGGSQSLGQLDLDSLVVSLG